MATNLATSHRYVPRPVEYAFPLDKRRLSVALFVALIAIQIALGLTALLSRSFSIVVVFAAALCSLWPLIAYARKVRVRHILDGERFIVARPGRLLRGGAYQTVEIFMLDACELAEDEKGFVLHEPASGRTYAIPSGLHNGEALAQYLKDGLPPTTIDTIRNELAEALLENGIEFRYGAGSVPMWTSIAYVLGAGIVRGLTGGDWRPSALFQLSGDAIVVGCVLAGTLIAFVFGPRYWLDQTGLTQSWFGWSTRLEYSEIERCSFQKRWLLEWLVIGSGARRISTLPDMLGDFKAFSNMLRAKCPDAWPEYAFPYNVEFRTTGRAERIAMFSVVGGIAAGVGFVIGLVAKVEFLPAMAVSIAVGWAGLAAILRWSDRRETCRLTFRADAIDWATRFASRTYPVNDLSEIACLESHGFYEFAFEFAAPHKTFKVGSSNMKEAVPEFIEVIHQLYPKVPITGMKDDADSEFPSAIVQALGR